MAPNPPRRRHIKIRRRQITMVIRSRARRIARQKDAAPPSPPADNARQRNIYSFHAASQPAQTAASTPTGATAGNNGQAAGPAENQLRSQLEDQLRTIDQLLLSIIQALSGGAATSAPTAVQTAAAAGSSGAAPALPSATAAIDPLTQAQLQQLLSGANLPVAPTATGATRCKRRRASRCCRICRRCSSNCSNPWRQAPLPVSSGAAPATLPSVTATADPLTQAQLQQLLPGANLPAASAAATPQATPGRRAACRICTSAAPAIAAIPGGKHGCRRFLLRRPTARTRRSPPLPLLPNPPLPILPPVFRR